VLAERRRRLALIRELVEFEIRRDKVEGHPERGRAARVARRLCRAAPARTIYRVFASLSDCQSKRGTIGA
jgi:hypothetical protein